MKLNFPDMDVGNALGAINMAYVFPICVIGRDYVSVPKSENFG